MSSLRQTFADTMLNIGIKNDKLTVLVGDISHGILQPFARKFPSRYYNIGICEPSIVGIAAGLAHAGLIPVAHTIAPFLIERSYEQIKLDFAYQQLAGNFITVGGAFDYGQLGCSHHCYNDVALMCMLDNTVVTTPASEVEFNALFGDLYDKKSINYFKLTENAHGIDLKQDIKVGKIIKICSGRDISLVAVGPQLKQAYQATQELQKNGIDVDLLYVHTIKPLDNKALLDSIDKTGKVVVCEELNAIGGVFDQLTKLWAGRGKAKFAQLAITKMIHHYGSYEDLCQVAGLTADNIVSVCRDLHG